MKKIIETITDNASLSTLLSAINKAELVDTLSTDGPFTVLAPNNDAFAKISSEKLDAVLNDKDKLAEVLTYHVIAGKVMAKDAKELEETITVQGGKIIIDNTNGLTFNGAKVIVGDIDCANGVIHIIDTVLMPI